MARVYERLGSQALPRELEDIWLENAPQYDLYEDETQSNQTFSQLAVELEPMPEVGDHQIGAEILLPKGDKIARGHVVTRSQEANGNVMDRAHTNQILDTRMYQVELIVGMVTELNINVIAESMYSQCDIDGNGYLLLDMLVDYCKNNKEISLAEKQISIQGRPVTHKTTTG